MVETLCQHGEQSEGQKYKTAACGTNLVLINTKADVILLRTVYDFKNYKQWLVNFSEGGGGGGESEYSGKQGMIVLPRHKNQFDLISH